MDAIKPESNQPLGTQTNNTRYGLDPNIEVHPQGNIVVGNDWSPNTEITLTIGANQWASQTTNGFVVFETSPFDLQAGQTLQMTDGISTRTHIIKNIAVTEINQEENSVSGTADPNSNVTITARNNVTGEFIDVNADDSGHWKADFTLDIAEGSNGYATQVDGEYNATQFFWYIPDPTISVSPRQDIITGTLWTKDAEITVTIGGRQWTSQSGYSGYVSVITSPFGLEAGQVVVMTDGTYTRTYTIEGLTITEIDEAADIVYGAADPNSDVYLNAFTSDSERDSLTVTTDGSGLWQADFSGSLDITRDSVVVAYQTDHEGNKTEIYWYYLSSYLPVVIR